MTSFNDADDVPTPIVRGEWNPGAVWSALRPGSRSGNRIVQATFAKPDTEDQMQGVLYLQGRRLKYCSVKAWRDWMDNEEGQFWGMSRDHIVSTTAWIAEHMPEFAEPGPDPQQVSSFKP